MGADQKDDEMLNGMLRHSPSSLSVEAISSTELMGIVLHYKFIEGPILLFAIEFSLFLLLFFCVIHEIATKEKNFALLGIGLLILIYFSIREFKNMWVSHPMKRNPSSALFNRVLFLFVRIEAQ